MAVKSSVSSRMYAGATNDMIWPPSALGPCRVPCLRASQPCSNDSVPHCSTGAFAQERYTTPDEAVEALVDAVRTDELRQVMRVLGPGSDEIVVSGDPVADAATRSVPRRLQGQASDRSGRRGPGCAARRRRRLAVPHPALHLNNTWRFDGRPPAGNSSAPHRPKRGERDDVCSVYVAAQKEYAEKGFAGKGVYALRFVSRPGERAGPYWPAPSGRDEVR